MVPTRSQCLVRVMKSVSVFDCERERAGCAEPVLNQKRRKLGPVPRKPGRLLPQMPACSFTKAAISAWLANQTPGISLMWAISFSRIQMRER